MRPKVREVFDEEAIVIRVSIGFREETTRENPLRSFVVYDTQILSFRGTT